MPEVAAFMITRDRLDYTKRSFKSIFANPGMEFDLYVFDNGSTDGTQDWIAEEAYKKYSGLSYWLNDQNYGIHIGANRCIKWIKKDKSYRFIMKLDNDIEFKTDEWMRKLVEAYRALFEDRIGILAPNIKGLMFPPQRYHHEKREGFKYGFVQILGGICRLHPIVLFEHFRFNERLPLATGGDVHLSEFCKTKEIPMAYVENIIAYHMDTTEGQMRDKGDYFERSWMERYLPYGA